MTAAYTRSGKRVGRRPKPKDQVLGVSVAVCMPRRLHQELQHKAKKLGYTRPAFVRKLLKEGLALCRLEKAARSPEGETKSASEPSPTTEEHDATR